MSKGRTGGLYLIREPVKVQPTIKDLFGGQMMDQAKLAVVHVEPNATESFGTEPSAAAK